MQLVVTLATPDRVLSTCDIVLTDIACVGWSGVYIQLGGVVGVGRPDHLLTPSEKKQ